MFDLVAPAVSYMVGLFQTDGTHSGSISGKGRLTIEVADRDAELLSALQDHIPCHSFIGTRTRHTNFANSYTTSYLHIYDRVAREEFYRFGVPVGKKSNIIHPPTQSFSRCDYLRGIIDGDGSVGFTGRGYPFISIVTASRFIAQHVCNEIAAVCGITRTASPNGRDGVFNIMVTNAPAVALAAWCYPTECLSVPRKRTAAHTFGTWKPAHQRFGHTRRPWTTAEDAMLADHSVKEAAELLGRTEKSVTLRKWRLIHRFDTR